MNRQRLSLSVLLLISLLVSAAGPSAARHPLLEARQLPKALRTGQLGTVLKDMLASYQRRNLSVTLDPTQLDQPHQILVTSLGATALTGEITINGAVVRRLKPGINQVNLAPYLEAGDQDLTLEIKGEYGPPAAAVFVRFEGADTSLNQTVSGSQALDYRLDIQVP